MWVKLSLGSRLTLFRPTFFSLSILLSSQVRRETIVGLERENPCTSFVIFHEFVRFTRIVLIKIKIEMGAASRKTSFHNEKQDVRNLPSNSPSPVAHASIARILRSFPQSRRQSNYRTVSHPFFFWKMQKYGCIATIRNYC